MSIRQVLILAALAVSFGLLASDTRSAPTAETLVRPGKSIGKVSLGMNLAQVRRALGPPQLVNRRANLSFGRRYVEYAWDYGWWLVGFEQRRGRLRVVRIETRSRTERTANGIRWGARVREVLKRYPNAGCRLHWARYITAGWLVVRHPDGRLTAFVLGSIEPREGTGFRPPKSGVTGFVVKEPVREIGVSRITGCFEGWETR